LKTNVDLHQKQNMDGDRWHKQMSTTVVLVKITDTYLICMLCLPNQLNRWVTYWIHVVYVGTFRGKPERTSQFTIVYPLSRKPFTW